MSYHKIIRIPANVVVSDFVYSSLPGKEKQGVGFKIEGRFDLGCVDIVTIGDCLLGIDDAQCFAEKLLESIEEYKKETAKPEERRWITKHK